MLIFSGNYKRLDIYNHLKEELSVLTSKFLIFITDQYSENILFWEELQVGLEKDSSSKELENGVYIQTRNMHPLTNTSIHGMVVKIPVLDEMGIRFKP